MRFRFIESIAPLASLVLVSLAVAGASVNTDLLDPATESPGLAVGDAVPDVALVTPEGEEIDLSGLYADGPLVVTFYRGGWCPYCNIALKEWAGRFDDLTAAGGQFIAITPEKPEDAQTTIEKAEAGYRVFIDPDGEVGKAFRVQFEVDAETRKAYKNYDIDLEKANVNGRWELPAPATFVIDTDGVIRWVHANWNYKADQRAEPDAVIAAVRGLD